MAATTGAMTNLPASQTLFLQTVEEPENNSINFRDSLKFFQEQLVINGASFPSPSSTCRSGNDTLKKNGTHFCREQNTDNNSRDLKDCDIFDGKMQSVRSCKIAIPTVDTILESVRVLRAIQKSQKERGSNWNLDITSQSDNESDFNLKSEWICVADIKQNVNNENDYNHNSNSESLGDNSADKHVPTEEPEMNDITHQDIEYLGEKDFTTASNIINVNHSFWPSNTLNENILKNQNSSIFSAELLDKKAEFHVHNMNAENLKRDESLNPSAEEFNGQINNNVKQTDISAMQDNIEHKEHINVTDEIVSDNYAINDKKNIINSENFNTPKSLSEVCRDLLAYVKKKNSNTENLKENIQKDPDAVIGMLKIETYDDIDTQKDEFLLNVTVWKENCSPNESNSTKLENNDSDSGVGTQRSASSLSPNVPNQMQKDSWSDTCSSQYASAECSPYHSLNSVFDAAMGLNLPGLPREDEIAESQTQISTCVWQEASEDFEESIASSCITEERTSPAQIKSDEDGLISVPGETHTDPRITMCAPENCEFEESKESSCIIEEQTSPSQIKSDEDSMISLPGETHADPHITISAPENGKYEESIASCIIEEQTSQSPKKSYEDSMVSVPGETHTHASEIGGVEQDTEGFYCFVSNYTLESPTLGTIQKQHTEVQSVSDTSDTSNKPPKSMNGHTNVNCEKPIFNTNGTKTVQISSYSTEKSTDKNDSCDTESFKKFTATSCDLISIVATMYSIKDSPAFQVLPAEDEKFEEKLYILSEGAFYPHPEDNYLVTIENSTLSITKDSQVLLSLNMKYGEVSVGMKNTLKVDNGMGRCVYIKSEFESLVNLKTEIELHCLKHWQTDCLQLVHYPLKCHQNVIIVDLGSCSTRAGILMDQPTLPTIFFPTICATDRKTGTSVYGMEALQPEVRQHSNLSFPVRPSVKITKHTIDIDLLAGLFKKIFIDLHVNSSDYTIQVCLPRNLSINAQNALVKLLLEDLKVKSVSLANQALLTLYAHDVSTAVVVNIGDRTEVLPVVDGFIVENGVTKLPYGGQRLIHHMKHGLAEKRISLSNDIDSFVVQYITENLAYVAEDYDNEMQIVSQYPDLIKKTITLQPALPNKVACKSISLEEARFKVCEGLFNPELWGLDSPGIHQLVNKAIQATGVDVRKKIAENIYVSGGVTMLPGFVERLSKEVAKLSKAKIVPNVIASNYRYHCTYIGACKFAKMEVFPQVCISLGEYSKNSLLALKKCALCF